MALAFGNPRPFASEASALPHTVYNTALEQHLRDRLGVRFADRPDTDPGKRPVREIVGVDPALNQRWSSRRVLIKDRQGELAGRFQRDHGRPPTPVEALQLAQQATLETRDAKHEPRSLAEQRAAWHTQAAETLGGPRCGPGHDHPALHPSSAPSPARGCGVGGGDSGESVGGGGGAAVDLAELACPRRSAAPPPGRRNPTDKVDQLVELLVAEVLQTRSVSLDSPRRRHQRAGGVASGRRFECLHGCRIRAVHLRPDPGRRAATRRDRGPHRRPVLDAGTVELALLESAANGNALDAGQAALVRAMCTSGARLQLAIAPAGAGKTTAMRTLARAWSDSGGQVIGLAPSAAAAAQLRDATGAPAETLAKLTWSIHHDDLPEWAERIGRSTLVIIDEAGMADTLSLDTAVQFIIGRGGSVRLVGDDQQLAAIGAGGVLRDIEDSHGAVRLTELHRFTDPAEAAATLALRDGRPEALGFYLDRRRVHVGDPTTTLDAVFNAWQTDRSHGLDAIMLAPTRELVSSLNQRARDHRLAGATPGRQVELADGNQASVGDLIITRSNDRRLRISATDWVKNGDRWTILNLTRTGGLTVRHVGNGRTVTLPADYVSTATELGYATTVHTAQGVTADTMHGVVTGEESRQQLYTMLTRGRTGNHVYVSVVGDGDPHAVIQPDNLHPRTAQSCSSRSWPATPHRNPPPPCIASSRIPLSGSAPPPPATSTPSTSPPNTSPDQGWLPTSTRAPSVLLNGLTGEPAWPTLRGHLLLLAAAGADPVAELFTAAARGT